MIEVVKILLPYILGMICAFLMINPMREWEDGWNNAKEFYNDWNRGFTEGFENAEKVYKDYDRGFGDGFESGWRTALEQEGEN